LEEHFVSKSMAANTLTRYLLALSFLAVALGIRLAIDPWVGHVLSHTTAITVVLLTAWYCGAGPTALIAALGYPVIEYLVLDHSYSDWSMGYLLPTMGLYVGRNGHHTVRQQATARNATSSRTPRRTSSIARQSYGRPGQG
jgi:hypothetical protein